MFEYREVVKCGDCGKVYDIGWGVPRICGKCGNRILNSKNIFAETAEERKQNYKTIIETGFLECHRLENASMVIARPTLRGWVFRNA